MCNDETDMRAEGERIMRAFADGIRSGAPAVEYAVKEAALGASQERQLWPEALRAGRRSLAGLCNRLVPSALLASVPFPRRQKPQVREPEQ